jgi:hypothetical protein
MTDIELLLNTPAKSMSKYVNYSHTAETKAKNSILHKGKVPWNKGMTGVQTPWNKGLVNTGANHFTKAVVTPLGKFDSVKEAAVAYGHKTGATLQKRIKKGVPGYEYI